MRLPRKSRFVQHGAGGGMGTAVSSSDSESLKAMMDDSLKPLKSEIRKIESALNINDAGTQSSLFPRFTQATHQQHDATTPPSHQQDDLMRAFNALGLNTEAADALGQIASLLFANDPSHNNDGNTMTPSRLVQLVQSALSQRPNSDADKTHINNVLANWRQSMQQQQLPQTQQLMASPPVFNNNAPNAPFMAPQFMQQPQLATDGTDAILASRRICTRPASALTD
ncbi:unnamed protein product [Vitrella brassicaformis CCMP3155]|uniref:Uncharacterized protein n=1 Tax=Vitrella brassicaformis (strain CCMP3155) TaxID=1169540 RepID=A0A0G4ET76_VITBC|nr:unnamed protein product [Vitrella brassicaformis CCMP3155]|eukprot:CEM01793.1 unnamed protein product [Vitrella brassicaformis CCMP3155]